MRAYFATKLSQNISRMPNGFLVCKNVPIARTGVQEYLGSELGIDEAPDKLFSVYREEKEVFDPAALASFEGVAFVDEHPTSNVTVDNASLLSRGFVKDVRRGEGEESDIVIADIIVTDANVIAEIESGKREISCGYACDYEGDAEGRILQRNIRGNHVALVGKGRAGKDVAIKDAEPQIKTESIKERREKFMKPKTGKVADKKGLLAKFFGMLTNDADPEVVAEIAEQLVEAVEEVDTPIDEVPAGDKKDVSPATSSAEKPADEGKPTDEGEAVPAWATAILERLGKLEAAFVHKKADTDPLDELEAEVKSASGDKEESVTAPVEEMDEASKDEEPALDSGSNLVEPAGKETGSHATADARAAIANAKKTVAAIKDENTRRTVADAMAGLIRQTYGIKPSTPKGSYGTILAAKQSNAKKINDSVPTFDNMDARQAAYDKRNPHIKKEGGK